MDKLALAHSLTTLADLAPTAPQLQQQSGSCGGSKKAPWSAPIPHSATVPGNPPTNQSEKIPRASIRLDRKTSFEVERAVFVVVLHRLMVSGSDRSCAHWMADYAIPGADDLALHHFYRAMAWLGEEVEPAADGALAPRCVKDLIEEALFERRRDLFSELGLVFVDTTSLSFEGAGGEALGAQGYSKDHRPDPKQMILAVVIDGEGRPVYTEMAAGNTLRQYGAAACCGPSAQPVCDRARLRCGGPGHDLGGDDRGA